MNDSTNNIGSKQQGKNSWVDVRRNIADVSENQRRYPRLEFHCPARIQGVEGVFRVTDISMGGLFLEYKNPASFEVGQILQLVIKVPTEYDQVRLRVRVANLRKRGVGLRFVDLTGRNQEVIRFCFETFKDTVPIR